MLSSALSQSWTTTEKNQSDRRSQRKKLIQKQPFKVSFLMRPKTGTAMANRKKWRVFFCFIFSDFFLASHNSRKITVRPVFYELSSGVTFVQGIFQSASLNVTFPALEKPIFRLSENYCFAIGLCNSESGNFSKQTNGLGGGEKSLTSCSGTCTSVFNESVLISTLKHAFVPFSFVKLCWKWLQK